MKKIKIEPTKKPFNASVEIPGSKSYTNRALIMAALTEGSVKILNPLFSDDTAALINCLKELGIEIKTKKNSIKVIGNISDIKDKEYQLNAKLSGTTIRFLSALCCIIPGIKILKGKESLNKRPIGELIGALKDLGAKIEYLEKSGFPPIKITSSKLENSKTIMHGDISSQFFSAILMIGPFIDDLEINVMGNQISKPYIDMTIESMKKFGVNVINDNYKLYKVPAGQKYEIKEYPVEGDFSSAGYFFAIAALTKSKLTLKNLNPKSKQGDKEFLEILEKMGNEAKPLSCGNKLSYGNNEITIEGNGVRPIEVNMENCPDQVQTLAVLAAFAKGKTVITSIRSLRVKETERVLALQNELLKMGIKTESSHDSLTIYGGAPKSAEIDTYNDHRMAMAFAVAGTALDGMTINNPDVVTKTFPDFWKKLNEIGVKTNEI